MFREILTKDASNYKTTRSKVKTSTSKNSDLEQKLRILSHQAHQAHRPTDVYKNESPLLGLTRLSSPYSCAPSARQNPSRAMPTLLLPPSPAVVPQSRRRRRMRGITLHVEEFHYQFKFYRWAELPPDAILSILHKLDPVELLTGGVAGVCRSWRRAARDEPELWRRIDMRGYPRELRGLDDFARAAVRRSEGRCEAFWGECLGDDDFLLFLADQAPSLRILRLVFCYKVTSEGFAEATTKFPLLEELELSMCHGVNDDPGLFEHVAKSCTRMKHVRHTRYRSGFYEDDGYDITDPNNDREALAIASMRELRSLTLFRDPITNDGLTAIVDNCPHLESLDIRSCGNITMDAALRAKCARVKTKTLLTHNFTEYCGDWQRGSAITFCTSCGMYEYFRDRRAEAEAALLASGVEDSDDCFDSHFYCLSDVDEADLEEHGKMLDKSMRRYNL